MEIKELIESNQVDSYLSSFDPQNILGLAEAHYNIGRVYCRSFANIDLSDHHYKIAETMFKNEGHIKQLILCKRDLAVNKELIGEYEAAYQGFRDCVDMSLEINYVFGLSLAAGGIGLLYHHLNDLHHPRVVQLTEDRNKHNEKYPDDDHRDGLLLMEAMYGNVSTRLRDRIRAQEILEKLVQTTKYPHYKWSATRFLIINYIDEMLLTRSTDLLDQAKNLFESLVPASEDNFILHIRLNILEARLEMISVNLTATKEKLEMVLEILDDISKSKVIKRFVDEVEFEFEQLKEQYIKWSDFLRMNSILESEVRSEELMNYIEMAQQSLKIS